MTRLAIRADLLDFTAAPPWGDTGLTGVRWRPDHWLLIDGERIAGAVPGDQPPGDDWRLDDQRGRLLMPGFIDSHVHCPQLDVMASHGSSLLDWLQTYTFPAEARFADPGVAAEGAARFLDALLAHGTTAAVVFPTVHAVSADALFAAAAQRGMRVIAGKVLMDRHAPDGLRDDVAGAERDCEALIQRWHGQGRNAYAVTVRFAVTSTAEQLSMAGALLARHAGLYMQTHVAENLDEVRWVAKLFPHARSYLDVYDQHGLLSDRAVLAHGIWLDAQDRAVLRDRGAQIAFCPSSNLFLGSGLFDWPAAVAAGHRVSLASDVGGGTSLSMLRTAADAYKVVALRGMRVEDAARGPLTGPLTGPLSGPVNEPLSDQLTDQLTDQLKRPLSAWVALHAATLGAAQGLGLAHEMGHLGAGAVADLALWDWACGPVAMHRDAVARGAVPGLVAQSLHARVFAFMLLGDERNLCHTYVAGRRLHARA